MNRISTHVLDTNLGKPAPDVPVRLDYQEPSGMWRQLGSAKTDDDGRCSQLLPENDQLRPGRYRLALGTAAYYAKIGITGLYPVVEITFEVRAGESHFHIPLLLSPNSYTTYRGS
jgi:5-hydroxyisourate hydrolase